MSQDTLHQLFTTMRQQCAFLCGREPQLINARYKVPSGGRAKSGIEGGNELRCLRNNEASSTNESCLQTSIVHGQLITTPTHRKCLLLTSYGSKVSRESVRKVLGSRIDILYAQIKVYYIPERNTVTLRDENVYRKKHKTPIIALNYNLKRFRISTVSDEARTRSNLLFQAK
jgi:hypothetical protein